VARVVPELTPHQRATAPLPDTNRAIQIGATLVAGVYVLLFASGFRFIAIKTALLPAVLICGLFARPRLMFLRDWVPLVAATLLFDAIRGLIWQMIRSRHIAYQVDYVIHLERALFGVSAVTIPLQTLRSTRLDQLAVLLHASHFLYFFIFGLVLWAAARDHFWLYRRTQILVMTYGLIGYAVIPTAPPWAAAELGRLPPLTRIAGDVYTHRIPELYGTFATNPVAAMPSLHVAFPIACALVGWRAFGPRIGIALALYALAVSVASIYLGEHYAVDALAGLVTAVGSLFIAIKGPRPGAAPSQQ
jgi:membrane-associated phospholipid phosphatase